MSSGTFQSSHVSHKDMKMESTTDEALIEEARLHVATIQMVGAVHIMF